MADIRHCEKGEFIALFQCFRPTVMARHLFGMFWQGGYYVDLALPFGLRSAPGIFNSVADLFQLVFG
jgi:hypothetical protein